MVNTSNKLSMATALTIVALLALLVGNYFGCKHGFEQGQRHQDKLWCEALEGAGVRMKGFPPCE